MASSELHKLRFHYAKNQKLLREENEIIERQILLQQKNMAQTEEKLKHDLINIKARTPSFSKVVAYQSRPSTTVQQRHQSLPFRLPPINSEILDSLRDTAKVTQRRTQSLMDDRTLLECPDKNRRFTTLGRRQGDSFVHRSAFKRLLDTQTVAENPTDFLIKSTERIEAFESKINANRSIRPSTKSMIKRNCQLSRNLNGIYARTLKRREAYETSPPSPERHHIEALMKAKVILKNTQYAQAPIFDQCGV